MTQTQCAVCDGGPLHEVAGYEQLSRVTSDCKPWAAGGKLHCCGDCGAVQKIADRIWLDEIGRIYGSYEIYHLSAGTEQVIFTGDVAALPRSRSLVDFVVARSKLADRGRLIDIGCGNGAALANFSSALPGWRLFGSELTDKALVNLRKLPNFDALFTVDVKDIPGTFDVVTMIHALEHMPAPYETVVACYEHLAPHGTLFIEVPDLETSPFDILVADHRMHFTRATLGHLTARTGATALELTNQVLPKEITFLGRRGAETTTSRPDPQAGQTVIDATVRWLTEVHVSAAREAADGSFGIFGTSIAGMWLYAALRDRVAFFVDEDSTRVGGTFEGRPIVAPARTPPGSVVFVPLAPAIAEKVVARLSVGLARFVGPPPFFR
jgi:SAM-dependent methyltransferase